MRSFSMAILALVLGNVQPAAAVTRHSAPLSLTASDGTGIELVSLQAQAMIEGPLAFTELHMTFRNPTRRVLEGRFSITMPEGAAISRFAMKIMSEWQEAEVVERQSAREIYESYLHRRVDPALLERKAGNAFRARVFPIPAAGTKEIIISYSQELTSRHQPYRLRLQGLPRMRRLSVTTYIPSSGRGPVVRLAKRDYRPDRDFELEQTDREIGLTNRDLSLVRIKPAVTALKVPIDSLLVLVDTSASRGLDFRPQVAMLGELIQALVGRHGERLPLKVACYDQGVEEVFAGPAGAFGPHLERIRERRALGASNLERALSWAGKQRRYRRLLVITDGVSTAGEIRTHRLRRRVSDLGRQGISRLDVVLVGGMTDRPAMRRLVAGGALELDGKVLDGDLPAAMLARRLSLRTVSGIRVKVPGAAWTWPATLDGVQAGDEALIYSHHPKQPFGGSLSVMLSGPVKQSFEVPLRQAARPLLERASVGAQIQRLSTGRIDRAAARKIVHLSTRHRVLSDLTAMLVLETEQDYARFGLARRGLTRVMVMGARGLELRRHLRRPLMARSTNTFMPPEVRAARARLEMLAGQISGRPAAAPPVRTRGPSGSISRSAGRVFRSRRARAPRVMVGRVTVRGSLDKAVFRRTIRQQHNRIRYCYEKELQADWGLGGRVTVQFIIEEDTVISSRVTSSSLNNPKVESCIAKVMFDLRFPRVRGGGVVVVSYPFVLRRRRGRRSRSRVAARSSASAPPSSVFERVLPSVLRRDARLPPVPAPDEEPAPDRATVPVLRRWPKDRPATAVPNTEAYSGRLLRIKTLLARKKLGSAIRESLRWRESAPGDLLALVALGDSLKAAGARTQAARAYGSIIDLYPSRADMRRFVGAQLEGLGRVGLRLAADTYEKAVRQRPDHPSGYRLLAFALLRRGQHRRAFLTLGAGLKQRYPEGRFEGYRTVLRADLGLVACAWILRRPGAWLEVMRRVAAAGVTLPARPSTRIVLTWETDASDVDLHIIDRFGNEADHSKRHLSTGGWLHNDVTTGYGPESFVLGSRTAFPYRLRVHTYRRGAMGFGLGKVQIIHHDGSGRLSFDERPYVLMKDNVTLDLGLVRRPGVRPGTG